MERFTKGMLNKEVEFFAEDKIRAGIIVGFNYDEVEIDGTWMFGGIIYTIEEENNSGEVKRYEVHESDLM